MDKIKKRKNKNHEDIGDVTHGFSLENRKIITQNDNKQNTKEMKNRRVRLSVPLIIMFMLICLMSTIVGIKLVGQGDYSKAEGQSDEVVVKPDEYKDTSSVVPGNGVIAMGSVEADANGGTFADRNYNKKVWVNKV